MSTFVQVCNTSKLYKSLKPLPYTASSKNWGLVLVLSPAIVVLQTLQRCYEITRNIPCQPKQQDVFFLNSVPGGGVAIICHSTQTLFSIYTYCTHLLQQESKWSLKIFFVLSALLFFCLLCVCQILVLLVYLLFPCLLLKYPSPPYLL